MVKVVSIGSENHFMVVQWKVANIVDLISQYRPMVYIQDFQA